MIDSSKQFMFYKPPTLLNDNIDIRTHYFKDAPFDPPPLLPKIVYHIHNDHQFQDYKSFDYVRLEPFLRIYFQPSPDISKRVQYLLLKYGLDVDTLKNTCVLFYRGNDKSKETSLCSYDDMIQKAKEIQKQHPNIQFLIQSDETEFFQIMFREFPNNSFCFEDEIRHMHSNPSRNVDMIQDKTICYLFSKWFLAITIIMSLCGYIVCTSGNCSVWIMYYRRNAQNVHQYLHDRWV